MVGTRLLLAVEVEEVRPENQADRNTYQKLTDLNLDEFAAPSTVDRRHVLAVNGRAEIPKTGGANVSATYRT